jgi:hypothetical protein
MMALAALIPASAFAQTQPVTSLNGSTTVATGGTFQTALAADPGRHGCLIQNPTTATEPLYVNVASASPSTANSFSLAPGSSFSCLSGGTVVTDKITVTAATTGHAFVMVSQ